MYFVVAHILSLCLFLLSFVCLDPSESENFAQKTCPNFCFQFQTSCFRTSDHFSASILIWNIFYLKQLCSCAVKRGAGCIFFCKFFFIIFLKIFICETTLQLRWSVELGVWAPVSDFRCFTPPSATLSARKDEETRLKPFINTFEPLVNKSVLGL